MRLADKLKRKQGGKTQGAFAAELGMTQPHLSMFYAGQRGISRELALSIQAKYPDLEPAVTAYLLGREDPDPTDKSEDAAA